MNFSETLGILRRRKWILIPMLVATGAVTVAAFVATPSLYEATSSLVLLAPTQVVGTDSTDPVNPFLNFGGSQDTAAQVLQSRMGDDLIGEELTDQGVTGEWTFEIQGGSGPLGIITVLEESSKTAIASAALIASTAQEQFVEMQIEAGSPDTQLISLKDLTTPSTTETVKKNKIRNAGAAGALMLLLTFGLVFGIEGISRSRRRTTETRPRGNSGESLENEEPTTTEPAAASAGSAWGSPHDSGWPAPTPLVGSAPSSESVSAKD